jgi:hypothetical protein
MLFLYSIISTDFINKGLKSRSLGYISIGDMVPEVRITDLNSLNIFSIAKLESKQAKFNKGSDIEPSV